MTLLTLAEGLALNVGMETPDQIIGSSMREWQEFKRLADAQGEELARRVDWGALQATATLTGDGTNLAHAMPSGFARVAPGAAVINASGGVVRPLTQAEWQTLTPVEGVPRYFRLAGDDLYLWPYLANAATVTVRYQSKFWCSNGTAAWSADDNTSLIDESLFLKGLLVRWRRQKAMDYADYEAEYEAALQQFANNDERARL